MSTRKTCIAVVIAVSFAASGLASVLLLGPVAADSQAAANSPAAADEPSRCSITTTHVAVPERVVLGDTVDVTLALHASCPRPVWGLHVVFVLDGSEAMAGRPHQEMKSGAKALIDRIAEYSRFPRTYDTDLRVGVVAFSDRARQLCTLTDDIGRAKRCVDRIGATGTTRIDLGILQGTRTMQVGRRDSEADGVSEVMIIASTGDNEIGCQVAIVQSRRAMEDGMLVMSKCDTQACDALCMRQLASSPRYYFRTWGAMATVFTPIHDDPTGVLFNRVAVTETLTAAVELLTGSARPTPSASNDANRWFRWDTDFVRSRLTHTYAVRPQEAGHHVVSAGAVGHAVDARNLPLAFAFTPPAVVVVQPTQTPTPMATTSPSPTATRVLPSSTPTPRAGHTLHLPTTRR